MSKQYKAKYLKTTAFLKGLPAYLRMCKGDMEEVAVEIEDFLEDLEDYEHDDDDHFTVPGEGTYEDW